MMNKPVFSMIVFLALITNAGDYAFSEASISKSEDTVVTSDTMEVYDKGEKTVFSGNVKVVRGNTVMRADKIIDFASLDKIEGEGNIHIEDVSDQGDTLFITGKRLYYDKAQEYAKITISPSLKKDVPDDPSQNMVLNCDEMIEVFFKKNIVNSSGNVRIEQEEVTSLSDFAQYNKDEKKLTLTGNPYVRQIDKGKINQYSGNKIVAFSDTKKISIYGNAKAIIHPDKNSQEKTE